MTTKADVIRVHQQHPTWFAEQIAAHLDCGSAYVRATAYRNDLPIPRKLGGRVLRRGTGPGPDSITSLGVAARTAGLSVADIQKLAETRRVHALAMKGEA